MQEETDIKSVSNGLSIHLISTLTNHAEMIKDLKQELERQQKKHDEELENIKSQLEENHAQKIKDLGNKLEGQQKKHNEELNKAILQLQWKQNEDLKKHTLDIQQINPHSLLSSYLVLCISLE